MVEMTSALEATTAAGDSVVLQISNHELFS